MKNLKSDVIVIGAGAAGISAAVQLKIGGQSLNILEARPRIGGRVFTLKDANSFPIELGAEYIYGKERYLWNLMEHYQLRLAETNGDSWYRTNAGLRYDPDIFKSMVPVVDALIKAANDADDQTLEQFASDLVLSRPDLKVNIENSVEFMVENTGAPASQLSLKFLALGELASLTIGQIPLRTVDGYVTVLEKLVSQHIRPEQLHLETIVRQIEWSRGAVFVTAEKNGQQHVYESKKLLVTLPLGVLKLLPGEENYVSFVPPLEQKKEALAMLNMAQANRIVATFNRRFWSDLPLEDETLANNRDFGFIHCQTAPIAHWWSQYPLYSHVLTGWISGPTPDFLKNNESSKEEGLRKAVVVSLAQIFAIDANIVESHLSSVYSHNWNSDPYAMGVYSYCAVNGLGAFSQLAEPLEETLFFAGEATEITGFSGTVHGALRSGFRAAEEILRSVVG